MTHTQVSVNYLGGPHGGQSALVRTDELQQSIDLPGGTYTLDRSADGGPCYRWAADPQRADRFPRDGDEASAFLADHDGATPVLEQDVASSTTISAAPQVKAPVEQTKTSTGSASRRASSKG